MLGVKCLYEVGREYSRSDIYELLELKEAEQGGDWLNGYHRHGGDYYVFCNVGIPGRTGHDHLNYWEDRKLIWHGKASSHFGQPSIQRMLSGEFRVLVFYRTADRDPFTFAGIGTALPHVDVQRPVRIDWDFRTAGV